MMRAGYTILVAIGAALLFTGCSGFSRSLPMFVDTSVFAQDQHPGRMSEPKTAPHDLPEPVHDDQLFNSVRAEQLEYRLRSSDVDAVRWELQGWRGDDYNKLWLKTEGEQTVEGASSGELEVQALYSRLVAPFWDFQIGLRYDRQWEPGPGAGRWFGVIGFQGLSPYEFDIEPALFVSEDGDVSARLTATTDFLITQRLILQPRFESELAFQSVSEFDVGEGFNYVDLGVRLRYEVMREVAPYIGINWVRQLGGTASKVRRSGGDVEHFAVVFGFSLWF